MLLDHLVSPFLLLRIHTWDLEPIPEIPPDLEELELLGSAPEEGVGQHLRSRGALLGLWA